MARRVMRLLLGVIGLGLLVVGATKVSVAAGGAGATVLILAGALLIVSPFIIDRVEQFSVSGTGLQIQLTREIGALGAPKTAQILDHSDLARFAESYAFVHEELHDPGYRDARVHLQDLLVERAAALARRKKFDASEVRTLFKDGSPLIRVLMLGLMRGDPSLADSAAITSAIADSRSGNEQYNGLQLALLCWPKLLKSERHAIQAAATDNPHIYPGSNREPLAKDILSRTA
jgi:hypothetical protein